MDSSAYVRCPHDPAHSILKSRLQFHLMTDHPNSVGVRKEPCPFNTTHLIDYNRLEEHKKICPDRGIVDNFVVSVGSGGLPRGVNPVTNLPVVYDDDEDWASSPSQVSVLNHIKQTAEQKPILINKCGLSKAKKREHILQERNRHLMLDHSQPPQIPPATLKAPVNIPSTIKAMADEQYFEQSNNTVQATIDEPTFARQPHPSSDKNDADFPSLDGNAGVKLARNVDLSGILKNMSVKENEDVRSNSVQSRPSANPWGKPMERSAKEEITVPLGSSRGVRTASTSQGIASRPMTNPWGRGNGGGNRGAASSNYANCGGDSVDPSNMDEFPSLTQTRRGKK